MLFSPGSHLLAGLFWNVRIFKRWNGFCKNSFDLENGRCEARVYHFVKCLPSLCALKEHSNCFTPSGFHGCASSVLARIDPRPGFGELPYNDLRTKKFREFVRS